jgi:hypothetical protein
MTYYTRAKLYALGEPFGEHCTRKEAGRIVYGGGGGGGKSTTVQSIPNELKPLATAYTNKAINLGNQNFTPYRQQRFAGPTGAENAGLNMIANRAQSGSQLINSGTNSLNTMLQPGQSNPYLDKAVGRAQESVVSQWNNVTKPQTESAMVNSGSFGNSGLQQLQQQQQVAAGKQLGDIAAQMYGQDYQDSNNRALQAAQLAPQYANAQYNDAQQLLNAGSYARNFDQQRKDFAYNQFQDAQNLPYKQLGAMSGVFGSNLGGTTTTTGGGGK